MDNNCCKVTIFSVFSVIVVILGAMTIYALNNKLAMENGYCEVQAYGTSAILWQKCEMVKK